MYYLNSVLVLILGQLNEVHRYENADINLHHNKKINHQTNSSTTNSINFETLFLDTGPH